MQEIIFVCHGNICRSAMAEFILKNELSKHNLEKNYQVESFGISNEEEGNDLDNRAKKVLNHHHVPYQLHHARKLKINDLKGALVFVMNDDQLNLLKNAGVKNIYKLSTFTNNKDIADPWYGDLADFEKCYSILVENIKELIKTYVTK